MEGVAVGSPICVGMWFYMYSDFDGVGGDADIAYGCGHYNGDGFGAGLAFGNDSPACSNGDGEGGGTGYGDNPFNVDGYDNGYFC